MLIKQKILSARKNIVSITGKYPLRKKILLGQTVNKADISFKKKIADKSLEVVGKTGNTVGKKQNRGDKRKKSIK